MKKLNILKLKTYPVDVELGVGHKQVAYTKNFYFSADVSEYLPEGTEDIDEALDVLEKEIQADFKSVLEESLPEEITNHPDFVTVGANVSFYGQEPKDISVDVTLSVIIDIPKNKIDDSLNDIFMLQLKK